MCSASSELSWSMEFRQLRYFVAVADAASFGRASTMLGIAQSAVSSQIARLEHEFGVELFVRSARTVSLTPAGRAVLDEARKTLAHADLTADVARRAARGETGRLRVGYARALPWHLPGRVVTAFSSSKPGGTIDFYEMSSDQQFRALQHGDIDAGITIGFVAGHDLKAKLIARESIFIACGPTHPFAKRTGVTLSELKDEEIFALTATFSHEIAEIIATVFREAGITPRFSYQAEEIRVLWGLVSGGRGVTFGYRSFAAANIPGLVFLPIVDVTRQIDFYLVTKQNTADPLLARLLEAVPAWEQT